MIGVKARALLSSVTDAHPLWLDGRVPDSASLPSPRARARARTMRDIVRIGRQHLATEGAAALSLRAVARAVA